MSPNPAVVWQRAPCCYSIVEHLLKRAADVARVEQALFDHCGLLELAVDGAVVGVAMRIVHLRNRGRAAIVKQDAIAPAPSQLHQLGA